MLNASPTSEEEDPIFTCETKPITQSPQTRMPSLSFFLHFPIAISSLLQQISKSEQPREEIMLHYAGACSSLPWVIIPVSLLPTAYWWFEGKPELIGLFPAGKAFSHSKDVRTVPLALQPPSESSLRVLVSGSIYLKEVCNGSLSWKPI